MDAMLFAGHFRPSLLSVPPGIALVALLVVIAYAAAVRGAAELRGWFLVHCVALVPYAIIMVLAPSLTDPALATTWFRVAVALVPLSASAGLAFRLAIVGRRSQTQRVVMLSASLVVFVTCALTPWFIETVAFSRYGFWFPRPGPLAPLWLAVVVVIALGGQLGLVRGAQSAAGGAQRRQLRRVWVAHGVTSLGLLDVVAVYYQSWFPLAWSLLGIGSVLMLRALVIEDLLRARAIDTRAPEAVIHVVGALLLGWGVLALFDGALPWWGQAVALVGAFASVHLAVVVAVLITRGARVARGTRERFLSQFAARFREVESQEQLDALIPRIAEIGVSAPVTLLMPSGSDWGWSAGGQRLADTAAPDPRLVGWLTGQGLVSIDDPGLSVPMGLRPSLDALFQAHGARMIVPLRARDELLGLLVVGGDRAVVGARRHFVTLLAERTTEALAYLRIVRQVRERAALSRDVELAAQMQAAYLPAHACRQLGRVRVAGAWLPATECGGDFWAVYDVGPSRALVVVGDVTGHGVPAALVTAAARGACDVTVRALGDALDLPVLGGAARRRGAPGRRRAAAHELCGRHRRRERRPGELRQRGAHRAVPHPRRSRRGPGRAGGAGRSRTCAGRWSPAKLQGVAQGGRAGGSDPLVHRRLHRSRQPGR
ncbi:MAG: SpoIIE family protein phosphatase [Myxococcales bacterium]|nr:SpoIIE family protein phosphatase [Myxococcales bacterium]